MSTLAPISFFVYGEPKTQGSMRAFVVKAKGGGKPRAVMTNSSTKTKPWKTLVAAVAQSHAPMGGPYDGPVDLDLDFYIQRPTAHSGRNGVKATAPAFPHGRVGDLDKLSRAVLDAVTAVLITDDARVCSLRVGKRYADEGNPPGVRLSMYETGARP